MLFYLLAFFHDSHDFLDALLLDKVFHEYIIFGPEILRHSFQTWDVLRVVELSNIIATFTGFLFFKICNIFFYSCLYLFNFAVAFLGLLVEIPTYKNVIFVDI